MQVVEAAAGEEWMIHDFVDAATAQSEVCARE